MSILSWAAYISGLTAMFYGLVNYEDLKHKYDQLSLLFQEVKNRNPTKPKYEQMWITTNMLCKSWLYSYLYNCNVVEVDKNIYDVFFVIKSKLCKFRVIYHSGPTRVVSILANGKDVTNEILPYLGSGDFHRDYRYTPNSFGHDYLKIAYWDEEDNMKCKDFKVNDQITLNEA